MSLKNVLKFYNADFCPFGQRTWLAILEKGVEHEYIPVNYLNTKLKSTLELYEINPEKTVPAGYFANTPSEKLFDSLPFNEFLEDAFPNTNPLLPQEPYQRFQVRGFIKKHNDSLVPAFYKYLMLAHQAPEETVAELRQSVVKALDSLEEDLSLNEGPYAFGEQFTLADISVLPIIERMDYLLPHYRNFSFLDDYKHVSAWYNACKERPSFKISAGARTEDSMKIFPFESRERKEFIIEVYEMYALGDVPGGRKQLADAPAGVRTYRAPSPSS